LPGFSTVAFAFAAKSTSKCCCCFLAVAFLLAVAVCGYSVLTAVIAVVKSAVVALSCIAIVGVAKECLQTRTLPKYKCENHVSLQAAPEDKRLFSTFTAIFYFSKFVRFLLLSFGFN
jgi:hypothetical protein